LFYKNKQTNLTGLFLFVCMFSTFNTFNTFSASVTIIKRGVNRPNYDKNRVNYDKNRVNYDIFRVNYDKNRVEL